MANRGGTKDDMRDWLSVWGTAIAAVVFALCTLTKQLNVPAFIWSDWAPAATVTMFASGLWTALVAPYKLVRLDRAAKASSAKNFANDLCQQVLTTVHQAKPGISVESLAVHLWKVSGASLDRMASYRVERRSDSGVTWTKGKGAVGSCWATNLEIEADLADLHQAAGSGERGFYAVNDEERFYLTWDEYQMTRRYQSILATPLRDKDAKFIGCLSIDTTQPSQHVDFVEACHGPAVLGLTSLIEQVLRDSK